MKFHWHITGYISFATHNTPQLQAGAAPTFPRTLGLRLELLPTQEDVDFWVCTGVKSVWQGRTWAQGAPTQIPRTPVPVPGGAVSNHLQAPVCVVTSSPGILVSWAALTAQVNNRNPEANASTGVRSMRTSSRRKSAFQPCAHRAWALPSRLSGKGRALIPFVTEFPSRGPTF